MRKQPKQERSRQLVAAIVDATAQAIMRRGLEGVSMRYVAELAGISQGSLYQYFTDRNDLIVALLEKIVNDFIVLLGQEMPMSAAGSLYELVLNVMRLGAAYLHANEGVYIELLRHWGTLPVESSTDVMQRKMLDLLQAYFLINNQDYPIDDLPERLFICFNSGIFTVMRLYSQGTSSLREERVLHRLAQMITQLLETPEYVGRATRFPADRGNGVA